MLTVITLKEIRESDLDSIITAQDISPLVADAIFRDMDNHRDACYFCEAKPSTRRYLYAYFISAQSRVEVCCTKCTGQLDQLVNEKG